MKRKQTGFTLIEMLAALVIAGILFAAAGPSIRGIFTSNRMATHLNQLSTAISYARSEAIKRVSPVAVGATGTWAGGWNIWVDNGLNPGAYDSSSEALLRTGTPAASTITLAGTSTAIVYQPNGTILVPDGGGGLITPVAATTFTLCYTGQQQRILTINTTGRPVLTNGVVCP